MPASTSRPYAIRKRSLPATSASLYLPRDVYSPRRWRTASLLLTTNDRHLTIALSTSALAPDFVAFPLTSGRRRLTSHSLNRIRRKPASCRTLPAPLH